MCTLPILNYLFTGYCDCESRPQKNLPSFGTKGFSWYHPHFLIEGKLVDLRGLEPLTFSMPWRRSPNCATGPCIDWYVCLNRDSLLRDNGRARHVLLSCLFMRETCFSMSLVYQRNQACQDFFTLAAHRRVQSGLQPCTNWLLSEKV